MTERDEKTLIRMVKELKATTDRQAEQIKVMQRDLDNARVERKSLLKNKSQLASDVRALRASIAAIASQRR